MQVRPLAVAWIVLALTAGVALGQASPVPDTVAQAPPETPKPEAPKEPAAKPEAAKPEAALGAPGPLNFLFTGEADAGFTFQRGHKSEYEIGFSPMFLVQLGQRLFIEAEADISAANNVDKDTFTVNFALAHANLSYIINDRLAVGAGVFTQQFAAHNQHFGASWINKLPDDPLPFGDRAIAPDHQLGIFLTGAAPCGSSGSIVTYSLWVANAPALITKDPDAAGSLNFDNLNDADNPNKAVGGRVGYIPIPGLEVGYSMMLAEVDPNRFPETRAFLWAVDMNWVREVAELKGQVTARAEWIWSNIDERTYDPTGKLRFGPLRFNDNRNGGYALLAYRPTKCGNPVLQNVEFVFRYDRLNISQDAPGGGREQRWTEGIDYWFAPSVVFKFAYEYDRMQGGPNESLFLFQFVVGF